jgi:hypothetical protein
MKSEKKQFNDFFIKVNRQTITLKLCNEAETREETSEIKKGENHIRNNQSILRSMH